MSEKNRIDCNPRSNLYKDMCAFLREFKASTKGPVKTLILGDWNEECIGKSNSKKICDEFGFVNIFDIQHL